MRSTRRLVASGLLIVLITASACSADDPSNAPTMEPARPTTPSSRTLTSSIAQGVPGDVQVMTSNLDSPWGIAFLPDGDMLITSRDTARLMRIDNTGKKTDIEASGNDGVVPDVLHGGEGGLLGIAVAQGYKDGDDIYLYRTTSRGNEVIKAPLTGNRLGEPTVIFDGIPAAGNHNGGCIAFGPDGMLYVTTGDAAQRDLAQDKNSLAGKILRITTNGEPAKDNPFNNAVWTYGHRNVQGIAWDNAGRMYASEFGQNAWDEVNLIKAGSNYGWPIVEGKGGEDKGFVDPLVTWKTSEASPSGIAVTGDAIYVAALRGKRLWRIPLNDGVLGEPKSYFTDEYGRLRNVIVSPDQRLIVITNNTDGRGTPNSSDDRVLHVQLSL